MPLKVPPEVTVPDAPLVALSLPLTNVFSALMSGRLSFGTKFVEPLEVAAIDAIFMSSGIVGDAGQVSREMKF